MATTGIRFSGADVPGKFLGDRGVRNDDVEELALGSLCRSARRFDVIADCGKVVAKGSIKLRLSTICSTILCLSCTGTPPTAAAAIAADKKKTI